MGKLMAVLLGLGAGAALAVFLGARQDVRETGPGGQMPEPMTDA